MGKPRKGRAEASGRPFLIARRNNKNMKCPYCAEEIQSEAIKCKHCGSDLTKVHVDAPAKPVRATNWKRVGVVSLVVLIAVIAIGAMAGNKNGEQSQTSQLAPTLTASDVHQSATSTVQASAATSTPAVTTTPVAKTKPAPKSASASNDEITPAQLKAAYDAADAAAAARGTYQVLYKTSGSDSNTTDGIQFNIDNPGGWTLNWSYDCFTTDDYERQGNFIATVYSGYAGNGTEVGVVNKLGNSDSGSYDFPDNSTGPFYVEVISECKWTVTALGYKK
jgi:hypothetical protein